MSGPVSEAGWNHDIDMQWCTRMGACVERSRRWQARRTCRGCLSDFICTPQSSPIATIYLHTAPVTHVDVAEVGMGAGAEARGKHLGGTKCQEVQEGVGGR